MRHLRRYAEVAWCQDGGMPPGGERTWLVTTADCQDCLKAAADFGSRCEKRRSDLALRAALAEVGR